MAPGGSGFRLTMPNPAVLKVVVTNRTAARAKYGASGWRRIRHAVTTLAKADAARGITTRFMAMDSAADAHRVKATAVTGADDVTGIKQFVDQVFATQHPAYLLLLGGPDLVALVNLNNPLWTGDPNDDPDPYVPSDLPYACETPLSFAAADYRGPTRVVGRLPDLVGSSDPSALLDQLGRAATGRSMVRLSPEPVFAVSAKVWQISTSKSVAGLPDVQGVVNTSPAKGPGWTKTELAPRLHFVNCHGGEFDPDWYGQVTPSNWTLPTAIAAARLPGLVSGGQVVATECCYGTAHWPPTAAGGQASAAMTYLLNGAAAVFGASTVAYGPAAANNYADVVCRIFLEEVLGGASTGRAALVARQRFIQSQPFLDPTDIKTLAQFNLLGDPSAVPFVTPDAGAPAAPKSAARRRAGVAPPTASASILARRETMSAIGAALDRTTLSCTATARPRAELSRQSLAGLIGREVPRGVTIRTYDADRAGGRARGSSAPARSPRAHVAFIASAGRRPAALVVVREQPDGDPEVRVVVRR
jgi:hypothetical protein